ncbi:MAG: RidA family protein [Pseudomonadota bacterium]
MDRQSVNLNSDFEAKIGFSRAVRLGNTIAVAGTAPIGPDGATVGVSDMYLQTLTCLRISLEAIEPLGATANDVIRTRIMMTDIQLWEEAARAHGEIFRDIKPVCTFVEVKGLIRPEWLVETEMDAVLT